VRFAQGRATLFAGAWTLVNTHEVAVVSGLAAAHRLGAAYPFAADALAAQQFDMYLRLAHGAARG
jgi:predicted NAD/FAD-binding protein